MDGYWILVGMMGSGKSTIGRGLAEALKLPFADTDVILQTKLCRPIPQLFQLLGEDAFRAHETYALKELQPMPGVLATGGGIVVRDENWAELRRLGTTIYLEATAEELIQRLSISKKRRPLLETEDWQARVSKLLSTRTASYERADIKFSVGSKAIQEVVDELAVKLEARI